MTGIKAEVGGLWQVLCRCLCATQGKRHFYEDSVCVLEEQRGNNEKLTHLKDASGIWETLDLYDCV